MMTGTCLSASLPLRPDTRHACTFWGFGWALSDQLTEAQVCRDSGKRGDVRAEPTRQPCRLALGRLAMNALPKAPQVQDCPRVPGCRHTAVVFVCGLGVHLSEHMGSTLENQAHGFHWGLVGRAPRPGKNGDFRSQKEACVSRHHVACTDSSCQGPLIG